MRRGRGKGRVLLIIGAIILLAGGYFWYAQSRYQYFITTPVNAANPVDTSFVIKKDDTVSAIAKNLHDKNLVLDEDAFKTYAKDNDYDRKIIAGKFLLNQTLTIPQIAAKITNPAQGELTLTIPEGTTIRGIDEKLAALDAIQPGEFVQAVKDFKNYAKYPFLDEQKLRALPHPLEGYLFPDTYFIDLNHYSNQDMIDLMLKTFQKRIPDELLNLTGTGSTQQTAKSTRSLYDIITMASIVEKEVRTEADRPIVAGILWKRLDSHWQIGADATLLYLKDDNTIDAQDLSEDSPYNTRKKQGLPPGPISNPGLKAIEAAANPKDSPYCYYLTAPGTGEVIYAKTNDEQNANKAKYLQ